MNKSESKYFNTAIKMDKALMELLETKPFEYITIKEICSKAGVNRSTFYLHYENTCDLLTETTRYVLDSFLSYFPDDSVQIIDRFQDCEAEELNFISGKYLTPYLSYIKENRRIFATAVAHSGSLGFDRVYNKMFEYIFDPILERFNYPYAYRKYVMYFYLNGINSIVAEWLKRNCEESIDEMIDIISGCVYGLIHDFDSNVSEMPNKK